MSLHFFESELDMPGGMVILPIRCTVVKTSHGIVVISPIKFTDEQFKQIETLGPVTDLVAPSLLHNLYLKRTTIRFPNATVWGPPGCQEKLPSIRWNKILSEDAWPHASDLVPLLLSGAPLLNEVVFLERKSKTLIVTDFVFNLTDPKGWAAPLVLRMMGTYKKFAVSNMIDRYVRNKDTFMASVEQLLQWDFDSIVMGHGKIVMTDGRRQLRRALEAKKLIS